MSDRQDRRAVITGVGVVAPNGIGTDAYWKATQQGENGIRPITRFDTSGYEAKLGGVVEGFDVTDYIDGRLRVQTDHWTHMALAASQMALQDAAYDLESVDPYKVAVITASSSGGNEFGQKEIQNLWAKGSHFVGAYQSIAWFYAATTGQIAIKHGMKGPCGVVVSEGAGGIDAINFARRVIRRSTEAVVSGGTEAPIGPYAWSCQLRNGHIANTFKPFSAEAAGYIPGEGGAILLVEEHGSATSRGAPHVYAEVAGYGATHDAYHYYDPAPDGRQYARAMRLALEDAGVSSDDIDVVFADGAGTPEGDAAEATALGEVFGTRVSEVPVTVPKTMVGRLYAGGAALDVATAALAIRDGVVPPTINADPPADGIALNLVKDEARAMELNAVLVSARGAGGFNSALVLRKVGD